MPGGGDNQFARGLAEAWRRWTTPDTTADIESERRRRAQAEAGDRAVFDRLAEQEREYQRAERRPAVEEFRREGPPMIITREVVLEEDPVRRTARRR